MSETDYLLKYKNNRERLLRSVAKVAHFRNHMLTLNVTKVRTSDVGTKNLIAEFKEQCGICGKTSVAPVVYDGESCCRQCALDDMDSIGFDQDFGCNS